MLLTISTGVLRKGYSSRLRVFYCAVSTLKFVSIFLAPRDHRVRVQVKEKTESSSAFTRSWIYVVILVVFELLILIPCLNLSLPFTFLRVKRIGWTVSKKFSYITRHYATLLKPCSIVWSGLENLLLLSFLSLLQDFHSSISFSLLQRKRSAGRRKHKSKTWFYYKDITFANFRYIK